MRVQVNLSEEMVQKADFYAEKMGVTRSALLGVVIAHGMMGYDKAFEALEHAVVDASEDK